MKIYGNKKHSRNLIRSNVGVDAYIYLFLEETTKTNNKNISGSIKTEPYNDIKIKNN